MQPNASVRPYLDKHPNLAKGVFIDATAVVIGDVTIGEDTSVWPGAVIRGDVHHIRLGARTSVQDNAVLHVTHASEWNPDGWPLIIGDDVTIGHNACLHGCTVSDRVLVGINATVLDGAEVPDEVMIAAGALVPPLRRLESGYLYVGAPVKKARPLTEEELAFFTYSARKYVALKNTYLNAV